MADTENIGYESSIESETSSVAETKEDEIRKKLDLVLKAFDQRDEQAIDFTDLGHVFRCMRVNITQSEMYEIEAQLVKENNNSVKFDYLIPRILAAVQEKSWRPKDETSLELAFQSLETSGAQLNKERMEMLLCTRGEPLSDAEFKDMASHLAIRRSGIVDWKSYVRDIMEAITNERI